MPACLWICERRETVDRRQRHPIGATVRGSPQSVVKARGRPFSNGPLRELTLVREAWEANVATGTVKKVVSDRGFGFITADDAKEYFFHRSGLDASLDFDRLVGGEKVEFDLEQSPKGPRATRVRAAA
jgi:CspA family cold shock protein